MDRNKCYSSGDRRRIGVALLTECVDRNFCGEVVIPELYESHSLRSAWIEIFVGTFFFSILLVALLTECVDRNFICFLARCLAKRRTPYGVRG